MQAKTLTTRITLASNNVLARLIAEVDDMGDLSFIDESLKLISKVDANTQKLLGRNRDDD